MPGFDIATLGEFVSPAARCARCLGVWQEVPPGFHFECPVCSAAYVTPAVTHVGPGMRSVVATEEGWAALTGASEIPSAGLPVDLGADPLIHARVVADRAGRLRAFSSEIPPMRGLMGLLLTARSFVHVTTFGMDLFMLGMLETVAQLVPVYVLASGLDPSFAARIGQVRPEAPDLHVRVGGTKADRGDQNHGKLIVVDGIAAITGSANLTLPAGRSSG